MPWTWVVCNMITYSEKEAIDKLPMFGKPVFTGGTQCTSTVWLWNSMTWLSPCELVISLPWTLTSSFGKWGHWMFHGNSLPVSGYETIIIYGIYMITTYFPSSKSQQACPGVRIKRKDNLHLPPLIHSAMPRPSLTYSWN